MKRGDIILFDYPFSDGTGSKLRPALVVQIDALNRSLADTILVLITRTRRDSATEVEIDITSVEGQQTGLHHSSVIDCKNLLTADKRFIHRTLGMLPVQLLQEVNAKLGYCLGVL